MENNILCLSNPKKPLKKILFMGYDEKQTNIIKILISKNCHLDYTNKPVSNIKNYDLIISFGYKYILRKKLIKAVKCPIINLHISYLPYNRGSHPNFWSFYDETPSGVSIHLIDEGVDTGPIIYQKYVNFDKNEVTFEETYNRLKKEIETLFIKNISNILSQMWIAKPQKGCGTKHNINDLPKDFSGWKSNISNEIKKLKSKKYEYES